MTAKKETQETPPRYSSHYNSPFLSGMYSSALDINSEQSSKVQLQCLKGLDVSEASATSSFVRTSRMMAPGSSAAALTSSGDACAIV